MTYRPTFRKQGDGSRCAWTNCGCASHAMAADRDRRGVDPGTAYGWLPSPVEIRNKIAVFCPGTTLEQNKAALLPLYKVTMDPRYKVPWDTFRSLIVSGRGAVVCISYSVISGTSVDGSPGFTGNHAIYVNERRDSDGAYFVYDPLADGRRTGIPKGPQWWSGSLLKRAAGAFSGSAYGYVTASYTRDTEV